MSDNGVIPAILPESDAIKPGETYIPSEAYLSKCNLRSTEKNNADDLQDSTATKKLLILDLNGTLISRTRSGKNASFFARPYFRTFFDYIFREFKVMVWSSAQEGTVNRVCQIFQPHRLLLKWHRGHFNLRTEEFHSNIESLKNLERVWAELPEYDETNTIVIDDTLTKLSLQPYNLIKVSTFSHKPKRRGGNASASKNDSALLQIIDYLKILKDEPNIAYYIKNNPFIETGTINKGRVEAPVEFLAGGRDKRSRKLTPPLPTNEEYALDPNSITSLSEPPKKKKKPRHKKLKKLLALQEQQEREQREQREQQQQQEQ